MCISSGIYYLDLRSLVWRKVFQKGTPLPMENPVFIADQIAKRVYVFGGVNNQTIVSLGDINYTDVSQKIFTIQQNSNKIEDERNKIEFNWVNRYISNVRQF